MGNTIEKNYQSDLFYYIDTKGIETDKDLMKLFDNIGIKEFYIKFCHNMHEYHGKQINGLNLQKFVVKRVPTKEIFELKRANTISFKNSIYNDLQEQLYPELCKTLVRKKYLSKNIIFDTKNINISIRSNTGNVVTLDEAVDFLSFHINLQEAAESFEQHKMEMENGKI